MWHQALDSQHSVRALFIDFSKAFDRADHTTVLHKMSSLNVHATLLRWMHSFLLHRQQRVKVGDVTSQWVGLNAGVPQGAWLGPLVFLVLINDLGTSMPSFKFVDDITVAEVLNNGAPSHMQEAADQIAHWSKQNYMNVNVKKTKEMLLGRLQNNPPSSIQFPHGTVEQVHSFKLLGLTITDQLSWEVHVDTICKMANKRLFF